LPRSPVTLAIYEAAVRSYQDDPGNVAECARRTGLTRPTCKRLWEGPILQTDPEGIRPIRQYIRELADEKRARAVQAQVEAEAAARAEAERRKKIAVEAEQIDESTLRMARSNALGALGALAHLVPGITELAKRISRQLVAGVNAQGQPVEVDPLKALRTIKAFSESTKDLVAAAKTLAEIERVKEGLPSTVIGVFPGQGTGQSAILASGLGGTGDDVADARDLLAAATASIERAERNKIAAEAVRAGKPIPTFELDDAPPAEPRRTGRGRPALPPRVIEASGADTRAANSSADEDPDLFDLDRPEQGKAPADEDEDEFALDPAHVSDDLDGDLGEQGDDDDAHGYVPAFGSDGIA